jgi:predicted Zn-ribbon and HTH transcriptional regulator
VTLAVAQKAAEERPKCELGDIFREYGENYRRTHSLPSQHRKVMRAIERCRTAKLGGHLDECDSCGYQHPAYNSCRDRHCPKCQSLAKAQWLEKQKAQLLPTGAFHLVFTLPHELNPLILCNKKALLPLLFKAVSQTLMEFSHRHLHGTPGFTLVLHTWDQQLKSHFHLHCLFPRGALSFDQTRWNPARESFLFHVESLSTVFRGKFIDFLEQAFLKQSLVLPKTIQGAQGVYRLVQSLRRKRWYVYSKPPFASPEKLLDYLGRYTHRTAISNHRIRSVQNGQVTFTYRERDNGGTLLPCILEVDEFIQRFLLHILPARFMRIRHFGLRSNRKKQLLEKARELLGLRTELRARSTKSTRELMLQFTGIDITRCPRCKTGMLVFRAKLNPLALDSS